MRLADGSVSVATPASLMKSRRVSGSDGRMIPSFGSVVLNSSGRCGSLRLCGRAATDSTARPVPALGAIPRAHARARLEPLDRRPLQSILGPLLVWLHAGPLDRVVE